ncbi:class I SAM-dependent methyltransferase [Larkinella bovis]|uniref:Class I SAM-dependent methyltransferase n=1 Tax=Larkinella bovis TaxID=683041 RepID=A0ABW0IEU7_9BACT
MQLTEAIQLINSDRIVTPTASVWADLGCGSGLFTFALAHYLPMGSRIYAVDQRNPLQPETRPNGVEIYPLQKDFVRDDLALPALDGILLANALHYVADKPGFLRQLGKSLKPDSRFLIVEYDTDQPVPTWVPYPVSWAALTRLFTMAGYNSIEKLGERPSRYRTGNLYAVLISR